MSLAPITATIDVSQYAELKIAAFRAHATQAPLFKIFENIVRQRATKEVFHLAASIHPGPIQAETDLFAGVRDEGQA